MGNNYICNSNKYTLGGQTGDTIAKAGHAFGETAEMPAEIGAYHVPPAKIAPGLYRAVTGTESMSWGLAVGAHLANLKLVFCSYPITGWVSKTTCSCRMDLRRSITAH